MSYRVTLDETPQDALRRTTTEQIAKTLGEIDDADLDDHGTVHQVRKRCKRIRALARLIRGSDDDLYQRINVTFRDIARRIAEDRDAAAAVETVDELANVYGDAVTAPFAGIREALARRAEEGEVTVGITDRIEAVRGDLEAVQAEVGTWTIEAAGFDAFAGGYTRTYGRARDRLGDVAETPSTETLHEWRKRVKYHRYHVGLLEEVWSGPMDARERELHDLTDLLGDDHDLAVLRTTLGEVETGVDRETLGAYVGLIDRRRAGLQRRAVPLGRKLFVERPGAHRDRVAAYWDAAVEQRGLEPLLEAPLTTPGAV